MSAYGLAGVGQSVWLRTLGGLSLHRAEDDSRPLMEAGKPLALLAYLALSPRHRAPRDSLADLLWPGDATDARHSLRQCLYRLRQCLDGAELIRPADQDLELAFGMRLDCLEAERAAEDGDARWAYERLQGAFLQGFAVPGSREFEDWVEVQRSRFRDCRARVTLRLAEASLHSGNAEQAHELGDELVGLRPFDDAPVRLVMRALAGMGRHATAIARFHAHADLLLRELEQEPEPDLTAYSQELERFVRARLERPSVTLPFVGRASQWAVLEAAWEGAQRAEGATVLVEGAAGLGKSRLLAELERRVTGTGGILLKSKCYEIGRSVPYGTVSEALARIVEEPDLGGLSPTWLAEAARLLPELVERFPGLPAIPAGAGPAEKRRLHQALVRCVEVVAEDRAVLVTVDDIHWADGASLEVLHALSQRAREMRAMLTVSYRPAELGPAARQYARSLLSAKLAEVMVLDPITLGNLRELVTGLGRFEDERLEAVVADQLHHYSAGNPLFVSELLEALGRRGVLAVQNGLWRLKGEGDIEELPRTLSKLMADRIDGLSTWMRACVEVLAVGGREIGPDVLAKALDFSETRAELALDVLAEERLVRSAGQGLFELVHDEMRKLVYQGIPDERRRLLHLAMGTALESLGEARRPGGSALLAHHFDQAGDRERAHRYALAAAGEAGALAAIDLRQAHLEMAEAHAPRALPPGTVASNGRHRRLVIGGGSALLLLGSAAVLWLSPFRGRFAPVDDYRQGTLYFASEGEGVAHRVLWPERASDSARLERVQSWPSELPPRVVTINVTAEGETHGKIFRLSGTDSLQLTFGSSDDGVVTASPDHRYILFGRGWRSSPDEYRGNHFVMDTIGRNIRQVTNGPFQDAGATWSPTGTRLAMARNSGRVWELWACDADGARPENLSTRFGLPRVIGYPAFSPDGVRLAVVFPDTGGNSSALYVLDLEEGTAFTLSLGAQRATSPPFWSPDGHWLGYLDEQGADRVLWMRAADGSRAPSRVMVLPAGVGRFSLWWGGRPTHVAEVRIDSASISLPTGLGMRARAEALDAGHGLMQAPIRWSVLDTSVAIVDELGFLRGRRAGTTRVVASTGGFRADTVPVVIRDAPVDTLLAEDWSTGLDSTRWTPFGTPRPRVLGNGPPDGRRVFYNNGDYNHASGALSTARFTVGGEGMTLEAAGWVQFTGRYWQIWQIALLDRPDTLPVEAEYWNGEVYFLLSGRSPSAPASSWICASAEAASGTLDDRATSRQWVQLAIQVRPDGFAECAMNGRILGRVQLSQGALQRTFSIGLRGQAEGARVYHGRVTLTRGLRY